LKPFHVLSNGEQFRVTLARTLAEAPELAVVDEFTSVVDRTVAQIGSAALAKTVRASNRRFVAVSCHYDIEEWLQPDWKYDTASGQFLWRSLRRRPPLAFSVRRVNSSLWKIFRQHHYLSHDLHRSAKCFVAEIDGRPAAFASVIHNPNNGKGWWREHRTVCLPDFQGVGLGNALSEFVAGMMTATGKMYRSTTSHPAMIRHRCKSPLWRMTRAPDFGRAPSGSSEITSRLSTNWSRPTAGFQFVGPSNPEAARSLGVI
jgi:GNAT superfamily N-acetyltransferase